MTEPFNIRAVDPRFPALPKLIYNPVEATAGSQATPAHLTGQFVTLVCIP